jgi:hypothetical protein
MKTEEMIIAQKELFNKLKWLGLFDTADDYAIEFSKWCNEYRIERIDYYQKTFEELLEIFKKEKGL